MHSDVNRGLGTMARGAKSAGDRGRAAERIKVLSFLPTPSKVKPITLR
ncbi:MAG: hypothetical protein LM590_01605 [Thermofilum sp.]|nr:hypothetical protein [Thermofilum sp.]